jgi:hypothetical protein
MYRFRSLHAALCIAMVAITSVAAAAEPTADAAETRSLEELRNTVVNLLQVLVDRGVLSREQAEKMVRDAQARAAAEAAAATAQQKAEEGAVRVPYVPEVVKEEIRRGVAADVGAQVTRDVIDAARTEGWGVPAALPDWVRRMQWHGDLRVRAQADLFAADNVENAYLNFQRINDAGGIDRAGTDAYLNTSVDRERLRGRFRLGFDTVLGYGWTMGASIATGTLADPVSTNITFGNGGSRYQLGLEQAWLDYTALSGDAMRSLGFSAGRLRNPFFTPSDLVFDRDLAFDGVAANYQIGLHRDDATARQVVVSVGAFPLQEVELSSDDKWLLGGQLGLNWKFGNGSRVRAAASYYDYRNASGRRNAFESDLLDYTAPLYLSKGNTLFDIRYDEENGNGTNLYALAADYQLVNYSLSFDQPLGAGYKASLAADYVQNIGYKVAEVLDRTEFIVPRRNVGYQAEIGFGSATMNRANSWRASLGYRYVQRDAVLDAYTDSDFRLGGTDARGYYLGFDYNFTPMVMARLKYMSANEIDGPPLGIDVLQIDLSASF